MKKIEKFAVCFSSATIESTNEKYKMVLNYFVDRQIGFEMVLDYTTIVNNEHPRTLFVNVDEKEYLLFKKEFGSQDIYLSDY